MDIRGVAASCGLKVGEKGEVGSGLSIISIGLRRTLFFFPVFFFFSCKFGSTCRLSHEERVKEVVEYDSYFNVYIYGFRIFVSFFECNLVVLN